MKDAEFSQEHSKAFKTRDMEIQSVAQPSSLRILS